MRSRRDIPSTFGADNFSAPIMRMPFGKRWLTPAVESESKQSCVIFSFYFMSFVATTHGGCVSLVSSYLLCIIVSLYLSTGIAALHMSYYFTNVTFTSYESTIMVQIYRKSLNFVSNFIIFCLRFQKKKSQMFSRSAVNGIP